MFFKLVGGRATVDNLLLQLRLVCRKELHGKSTASVFSILTGLLFLGHVTGWCSGSILKYMQLTLSMNTGRILCISAHDSSSLDLTQMENVNQVGKKPHQISISFWFNDQRCIMLWMVEWFHFFQLCQKMWFLIWIVFRNKISCTKPSERKAKIKTEKSRLVGVGCDFKLRTRRDFH